MNNEYSPHTVDVWRTNESSRISTLFIGESCYSIFIDSSSSLYCSLYESHRVVKRSLNSSDTHLTTVAGIGCAGYKPNMLYGPRGILVTIAFDLYVADGSNHRDSALSVRPGEWNNGGWQRGIRISDSSSVQQR